MTAEVFWIPGPWQGRLGIVRRPRGGEWLDDEMRAWRKAGIDMVVSLLEFPEEAELALEGESAAAAANGIEFRPYPVPDRGVPSSREAVTELASKLVDALNAGKTVAVHCRQGIGRSALIAGVALVSSGQDPETALETIGRSRGVGVPDTEEQRDWLTRFASPLPFEHAARPGASTSRPARTRRLGG